MHATKLIMPENNPSETELPNEMGLLRWIVKPSKRKLFLPISGLLILGLDWLLFSTNALSGGLATPLIAGLGFLLGTLGTFALQKRLAQDNWWKAAIKAVIAGIAVGVPWPLGGTILGGWVLLSSGLSLRER